MRVGRGLRGVVVVVGLLVGVARAQLLPPPPTMPPVPSAPPVPSGPPMPSAPSMPSPGDSSGPPADTSQPQQSQGQGNNAARGGMGFVGAWCAQGDPTKQTSISYNGSFFNLTNESGDTSIGNLQGNNQIQAPGWQFVTGTLGRNGTQINWSNGTFWARCPTPGYGHRVSLNGNWYPNGNRSLQCSIQDRRGSLMLQNESGQRASGSFNGKFSIATNWQGTVIHGTLSRDGNRINWDNGTYWVRYRLYTQ
jgi:hypothetical protein